MTTDLVAALEEMRELEKFMTTRIYREFKSHFDTMQSTEYKFITNCPTDLGSIVQREQSIGAVGVLTECLEWFESRLSAAREFINANRDTTETEQQ